MNQDLFGRNLVVSHSWHRNYKKAIRNEVQIRFADDAESVRQKLCDIDKVEPCAQGSYSHQRLSQAGMAPIRYDLDDFGSFGLAVVSLHERSLRSQWQ
jgi:hypothetical protein